MRRKGSFVIEIKSGRLTPAQRQLRDLTREAKRASGGAGKSVLHLDRPDGPRRGRFAVVEKARRTIDDIVFDSKAEMSRYLILRLREKAKQITDLTLQPAWSIEINGRHFTTYRADFAYFDRERRRAVIEDVKSTGTQKDEAYRLRKRAAELAHGIVVEEVLV